MTYDLDVAFDHAHKSSCTLNLALKRVDPISGTGSYESTSTAYPFLTLLNNDVAWQSDPSTPQMQLEFAAYPNHEFVGTNVPEFMIEATFNEGGG